MKNISSASTVLLNAALFLLVVCTDSAFASFLAHSASSSSALRSSSSSIISSIISSSHYHGNKPTIKSSKISPTRLHLFNLLQQQQQPASNNDSNTDTEMRSIPYIIDRVSDRPNDRVFEEIADMCIEVFFNEEEGQPSPWKKMQLGYLRGIQSADLRRRRTRSESKNEMLVARRVIPMDSPEVALSTPLILDWGQIYNMERERRTALVPAPYKGSKDDKRQQTNRPTMDYVRGEILGFCEVTERAYGLGDDDKPRRMQAQQVSASTLRPILTNLSVKDEARKSGIGSQLVEACEATVARWVENENNSNGSVPTEIILEVESDNDMALAFYKKRGYEEVFTDPACRRYTTNGFLLSKERCSKICMRKDLNGAASSSSDGKPLAMDLSKMLQSIRENVFN